MLTSYSEYQFEKMLQEVGEAGTAGAVPGAVPMAPAATTAAPGKQGQNPQVQQQIKGLLTQAWNLIKQTPNAKQVQPVFADLLAKTGFSVTGYNAQAAQQAQAGNWQQQLAKPLNMPINPNTKDMLTHFPKLTQAIQQFARKPDEQQAYAVLLQNNQHRFPEWEKMIASGQMQPKDLYKKAYASSSPTSARSFGMG